MEAGTRLGPYEILSPLGAGGMGEVYKARDTRLDRTVAVKILPSHLSATEEMRQRFEREAKTISQLSHPHICALFDVGHHDGIEYIVMEYLEGETLADRLAKSALPVEQTLRFGMQIADALDRAHRQGIVHRDLKPGNVMLTKSGVKLLDFGLAKIFAPAGTASGLTALPTVGASPNLTQAGTILGTFQYMAPEQLEGKEADGRTDIFAFGAVLYEMATGRKAFEGKSQASLIAAILTSEPPAVSTAQPLSPPALDRVVRSCLAKDPEERWQSAHDVASELQWISQGGSQAGVAAPVTARRKNRERLAWTLAAALAAALAALAAFSLRRSAEPRPPVRFLLASPEKTEFAGSIAVSPDGRQIAIAAFGPDAVGALWLRSLDSLTPRRLAGTERGRLPFWSPDGRSIAFFSNGKLRKIDVAGGPPVVICDALDSRGGTWGPGGVILFAPNIRSGLFRVSAAGGVPTPLTTLEKLDDSHRWPEFLPDGHHFLYLALRPERARSALRIGDLDSNFRKEVLVSGSRVGYAAPGFLLFSRDRTLMGIRFSPKALATEGEAFPIAEGLAYEGEGGLTAYAPFSVSLTGTLAYRQTSDPMTRLVWFGRDGQRLGSIGEPAGYHELSLFPRGDRVAVAVSDEKLGTPDVWIVELARGTFSRFTFDAGSEASPAVSPDGSRVAYGAGSRIYQKLSSGAGTEEVLLASSGDKFVDGFSPDGRYLVFEDARGFTNIGLSLLPLFGDRKVLALLAGRFNHTHAQVSPDGRWFLYSSDETGRSEVYLGNFPKPAGKWQISTAGGDQAQWRADGRELFYVSDEHRLMHVDIDTTGSEVRIGEPAALFAPRLQANSLVDFRNQYVASPDGRRFLITELAPESNQAPMTVVLDWTPAPPR